MRPYLAILKDSFHAALASRVLWVALVAIWLLLAVLAPIGYREDFTTDFRNSDFQNGTRLKALLARGLVDPKSFAKPVGRIAARLPDDLKRELTRVGEGDEVRIRISVLADALNGLLDDESWYDAQVWEAGYRLREQRQLDSLADQELSDSLRRRRARLRLESVLPGVFQSRSSRSIIITYAGNDFPTPVAVDKAQFETVVNQFVMPFIIDWALGFALILLGILVTAAIIPDMLQPGSLHLLLSKPISRPLLLLSKFLGGCAFVFLCVLQLIVGLYLIAGLRLDLWNERLLLCIPVAVFSFAVYYSISMVAGLRWRSPILSIGVTVICGTFFLLVGFFGQVADEFVKEPDQLRGVAMAGETFIASTRGGGLVRLDQETNQWEDIIEADAFTADRVLAPVQLNESTVATALVKGGRFNLFGTGSLDLLVVSESNDWKPEPSLRLPSATSQLFMLDDQTLMAMNTSDLAVSDQQRILAMAGEEPTDDAAADESSATESGDPTQQIGERLGNLTNLMGGATEGFEQILPRDVSLSSPRGLVIEPDGQWMIAWTRSRIVRLERPEQGLTWQSTSSASLPGESSQRGRIGLSGDVVLIARNESGIQLFDAQSLETVAEIESDQANTYTNVLGLGGGRFVLVTSDGTGRVLEPIGTDKPKFAFTLNLPIDEILKIQADTVGDKVIVVHHIDQIDILDRQSLEIRRRIRPELSQWRLVDRYFMSPLRMAVPQTGELGETIASIISGKSGVAIPGGPDQGEIMRYNIFRPVISCGVFILVMLTISCVYFSTRDF